MKINARFCMKVVCAIESAIHLSAVDAHETHLQYRNPLRTAIDYFLFEFFCFELFLLDRNIVLHFPLPRDLLSSMLVSVVVENVMLLKNVVAREKKLPSLVHERRGILRSSWF